MAEYFPPPVYGLLRFGEATTILTPGVTSDPKYSQTVFFERRLRVMTRAFGSPKTPRTVGPGRKPGNAYVSDNKRLGLGGGMAKSCQNSTARQRRLVSVITGANRTSGPVFTHTITR